MAGSQRVTSIFPRSGRKVDIQALPVTPDGTRTFIYRGGVNIVTRHPKFGIIDIEAESAVIWKHPDPKKGQGIVGPNGELIEDPNQPMEVYAEGNVILRQDENKVAGRADQRTFRAKRAFYDFLTDRFLALDGEVDVFAPGFIAPMKIKSPRIEQFHKLITRPDGTIVPDDNPEIRADQTVMTGSRFPNPAYQINNRFVDLTRKTKPLTDPNTGRLVGDPNDPKAPMDMTWRYDARQNVFWMGWVPVFYWPQAHRRYRRPRGSAAADRLSNQQLLRPAGALRLERIQGLRPASARLDRQLEHRPRLPERPHQGLPRAGQRDRLVRPRLDPRPDRSLSQDPDPGRAHHLRLLRLHGHLGTEGPRASTCWARVRRSSPTGPPARASGDTSASDVPPFQEIRGRFNTRHMQRFLPDDEEHRFEDLRLQLEVAYVSDRHFLEEYYKRLNETGMDQETLLYMQHQKDNTAWDLWTEANLQNFYTDTQWLPRLDYYRLGDSLANHWFNYYQHSGVDYANTHTDVMVNNPNLFAFMPYDPISNTSGVFQACRGYTNHEIDMPLNIYNVVRVVPYVQGQLVGWTDQIGGGPFNQQSTGATGRYWGAAGVHAETTIWKRYPERRERHPQHPRPEQQDQLLRRFPRRRTRTCGSNSIAVQDDLDDNTYEFVTPLLRHHKLDGRHLALPL